MPDLPMPKRLPAARGSGRRGFAQAGLIRHPDVVPAPYPVRGKLQSGTISGSRFSPGTLDSGFRRNDNLLGNH